MKIFNLYLLSTNTIKRIINYTTYRCHKSSEAAMELSKRLDTLLTSCKLKQVIKDLENLKKSKYSRKKVDHIIGYIKHSFNIKDTF